MNTITLTNKNLKRFLNVFETNLLYLNILDIDILTIDSIKIKLNTAYLNMKQTNSKSQTLTFTIIELRVFKKLLKEYISYKKNYQQSNSSETAFDEYLKKFKGANNGK